MVVICVCANPPGAESDCLFGLHLKIAQQELDFVRCVLMLVGSATLSDQMV